MDIGMNCITRLAATALLSAPLLSACTQTKESEAAQAQATTRSATVSANRHTAITDAVAKVAPTVVTVQTEIVQRVAPDPFGFFFGDEPTQQRSAGLGTGFIIRPDGVIVTNAHVVAGATQVSIMMRDGKTFPAKVLGSDEINDVAVLKIDASGLPVAKLGNSQNLLIGEWAVAIGNPYGFLLGNSEPSVTAGVISGTGRNLVARGEGSAAYFDMIQTDASINPGNSGGPLVDADGEVIGVNSSIYSTSGGGSIGLGFAIPINRVVRVVDDLLEHGAVRRPWIGVKLRVMRTDNPREAITQGAVISTVVPGSPAEKAGLQPGDVIVREGDRPVHNQFDWEAALLDMRVGQPANLRIRRGSREMDVTVPVADQPEVTAPKVQVLKELELVTVTPAIQAERNLRFSQGALIFNVSDRVANDLGIQRGDVIVQINNTRIRSAEDAAKALNYYGGRGPIRMFLERDGQIYITDFTIR